MTFTTEQLNTFTDAQIRDVFMPLTQRFDDVSGSEWEHSEHIWIDVYEDVIKDRMTDAHKKSMVIHFDEVLDGELNRLDSYEDILSENEYLKEDVGFTFWDTPEFRDDAVVYVFRYLMENDFYTEAFVEFLNEELVAA